MTGLFVKREGLLIGRRGGAAALLAFLLSACSPPQHDLVLENRAPPADALYRADPVTPGRLAYAPDRKSFAPVLTEPFTYPTQPQAEHAWQRARISRVDVAQKEGRPPPSGCLDASPARSTT